MRNHLEKSSVAQCLDETRLTGRLLIPVIFYLRRRLSERKSSVFTTFAMHQLNTWGGNFQPARVFVKSPLNYGRAWKPGPCYA
jgi:hypothetical protein